jgi:eukaryotic-like serine/threonine-protein kinase
MGPDRWREIEEIYHRASQLAPGERAAFLDDACSDSELRREVESLLAQSEESVLDRSVAELLGGGMLGHYRILNRIAAGGMGSVYKARDSRIDRTVAIKLTSARFNSRFDREARAIAALNHPHICTLYDVGPNYLVMEHVEGKPLCGPVPLAEALRLGIQLADALDAAHRKGIVHRDLKPANILLTKSGVKVLDFGLARLEGQAPAAATTVTQEGAVVGTPQYMSPEQVQGKSADARSDIFAFGLVLYELIAGQCPFRGDDAASLFAAILTAPAPPVAPPAVDRILQRCLAKDPEERWQSSRDVKVELEWIARSGGSEQGGLPPRRRTVLLIGVIVAAAILGGVIVRGLLPRPLSPQVVRFTIPAPAGMEIAPPQIASNMAISPDGSRLAVAMIDSARTRALWLRPIGSEDMQRLAGTEGAMLPFWSPDSQSIGFFAGGKLKTIPAAGGAAVTLTDVTNQDGGAWNQEGTILFAARPAEALWHTIYRISATGGEPRPALEARPQSLAAVAPSFLPDGRQFLFWQSNPDRNQVGVWIASLDKPGQTLVLATPTRGAFVPPDYLLYVQGESLFARRMDLRSFRLGDPTRVTDGVNAINRGLGEAVFSASSNGVLLYRRGSPPAHPLAWYSRDGKRLAALTELQNFGQFRISPNGKRVVMENFLPGQRGLWVLEFASGVTSRISFGQVRDADPVWSPDSRHIAYVEIPVAGKRRVIVVTPGENSTRVIHEATDIIWLHDWSPDGRLLIGQVQTDGPVFSLPTTGDGNRSILLDTPFEKDVFRFSPDGRWLAYNTAESGTHQVYVAAFPSLSGRLQISSGGGCAPHWREDGRELFYISLQGDLVAVPIKPGPAFETGNPEVLFRAVTALACNESRFAPSADGRKLLILDPGAATAPEPLHVILNFHTLLPR